MADLEIPLLDPDAQVKCDSCVWSGKWIEVQLKIVNFTARIAVADKIPAGQCPECSDLVFLVNHNSVGDHGLSYTARRLFPLFSELHSGLVKLISDGVITPENTGEHWHWLRSTIDKIQMRTHEVLAEELERILRDR